MWPMKYLVMFRQFNSLHYEEDTLVRQVKQPAHVSLICFTQISTIYRFQIWHVSTHVSIYMLQI
jgi:hypothetical protein